MSLLLVTLSWYCAGSVLVGVCLAARVWWEANAHRFVPGRREPFPDKSGLAYLIAGILGCPFVNLVGFWMLNESPGKKATE